MRRFWELVRQVRAEAKANTVPLVAAGVAFYAMLATVPAIIAVVTLYGLVADPAEIPDQLGSVTDALPEEARDLLISTLVSNASSSRRGLTLGLVVSLAATVWAAGGAVRALLSGLNIIHETAERRGLVRRTTLAVGLTLGGLVAVAISLGLVAAFPLLLDRLGLESVAGGLAEVARWLLLGVLVTLGLSILYRWGPARASGARWRWLSLGTAAALGLWLVGSVGFALYVSNFGSYDKTYGSLAAVVVLMLWLYLSAYAILLGAQVDAVRAGTGQL